MLLDEVMFMSELRFKSFVFEMELFSQRGVS